MRSAAVRPRFTRLLLVVAALVRLAPDLHAQDIPVIRVAYPVPLRTAYRAGLAVMISGGFPLSMRALDQMLATPERVPDGRFRPLVVQMGFERKADSTLVSMVAVAIDTLTGRPCTTDRCLQRQLLAEGMIGDALNRRLKGWRAAPDPVGDSLRRAQAFGYVAAHPVRLGGGRLEDGERRQFAWLDRLRGPRVLYLDLYTPAGPQPAPAGFVQARAPAGRQ